MTLILSTFIQTDKKKVGAGSYRPVFQTESMIIIKKSKYSVIEWNPALNLLESPTARVIKPDPISSNLLIKPYYFMSCTFLNQVSP